MQSAPLLLAAGGLDVGLLGLAIYFGRRQASDRDVPRLARDQIALIAMQFVGGLAIVAFISPIAH